MNTAEHMICAKPAAWCSSGLPGGGTYRVGSSRLLSRTRKAGSACWGRRAHRSDVRRGRRHDQSGETIDVGKPFMTTRWVILFIGVGTTALVRSLKSSDR